MENLPRPDPRDDPLFSIRVAVGVTLAFLLVEPLAVPVPLLMPMLTLMALAGQRGAFNARKAFGSAIVVPTIAWVMAAVASLTRVDPAVFIMTFSVIAAFGFYLLIVVASPFGIPLLLFPTLLSVMALASDQVLIDTRDALIIAGLSAGALARVLYWVLPPRTREIHQHPPERSNLQRPLTEVLIRMAVFLPSLFPFYYGADPSAIVYIVILVFVLGHPEHVLRRREAVERVTATCIGAGTALMVLTLLTVQPHLPVLLVMVLIAGLWFGQRMMTGPYSPTTYQFGYSVMVVIIASSLTGRDPWEMAFQRLVLTLAGATAALVLLALLEEIVIARPSRHGSAARLLERDPS